mgnify:CR=1 FL=1
MTLKELIERKYKERRVDAMESIINGVRNFEEYQFYRGYIRGMYDFLDDITPYLKDPDGVEDDDTGR